MSLLVSFIENIVMRLIWCWCVLDSTGHSVNLTEVHTQNPNYMTIDQLSSLVICYLIIYIFVCSK